MAKAKIWLAGPRAWENPKPIKKVIARLVEKYGRNGLIILQGEAPGVDLLAKKLAVRNGISVVGVPALWDKRGRAAGPIRNKDIAELGPSMLVALYFKDDLIDHPGTFSAVTIAHEHQIGVSLVKVSAEVAMPSLTSPSAPMGARARAAHGMAEANGRPRRRKKAVRKA